MEYLIKDLEFSIKPVDLEDRNKDLEEEGLKKETRDLVMLSVKGNMVFKRDDKWYVFTVYMSYDIVVKEDMSKDMEIALNQYTARCEELYDKLDVSDTSGKWSPKEWSWK
jgi:hypothetical protein